jgi:hypothetical protein
LQVLHFFAPVGFDFDDLACSTGFISDSCFFHHTIPSHPGVLICFVFFLDVNLRPFGCFWKNGSDAVEVVEQCSTEPAFREQAVEQCVLRK